MIILNGSFRTWKKYKPKHGADYIQQIMLLIKKNYFIFLLFKSDQSHLLHIPDNISIQIINTDENIFVLVLIHITVYQVADI